MPVAASLAHIELGGHFEARQTEVEYERMLDDAATALATLGRLYHGTGDARTAVPPGDVIAGRFTRGAKELHSPDGRAYRNLSMDRDDLMQALRLLKSARGR